MATQLPCWLCEENGVHSDSHWIVTAQEGNPQFPPGFSRWVCQSCLFAILMTWAKEQETEADQYAAEHPAEPVELEHQEVPVGPGLLEQIEADEGVQPVGGSNGRGRKSKAPPDGGVEVVEGTEEAETADVHE